ncbi:hypothetical protein D9M71_742180 [compost metagenome]
MAIGAFLKATRCKKLAGALHLFSHPGEVVGNEGSSLTAIAPFWQHYTDAIRTNLDPQFLGRLRAH